MNRGNTKPDLVIRNAWIVDGTGAPRRKGGVAVVDDRIVAAGELGDLTGATEIDAGGRVLAPGFIDAHTHDDRALLVDPLMTCKVSQGVTTVVAGNCGVSLAPLTTRDRPPAPLDLVCADPAGFYPDFGAYLDALDADPVSVCPRIVQRKDLDQVGARLGQCELRLSGGKCRIREVRGIHDEAQRVEVARGSRGVEEVATKSAASDIDLVECDRPEPAPGCRYERKVRRIPRDS
ncbi:MAG: amidohydrolase family protein, partial [Proteobacteria bacterium]|nr:amidohydrolase family protein [Pseudomonadota bacterium]